ncbi:MAG: hypothetical protein IPL10_07375 [Bacteroidetes bacterium]|nr:hypothetical protein [Bacteroidota bacterium]
MKKITILITLLMLSFSFNYAQSTLLIDRSKEGQSTTSPKAESTKTVTPEKTQAKKNDHEGKVLSNGFVITAITGGNLALTSGNYGLAYRYSSYSGTTNFNSSNTYELKNAIGYRAGLGIGFQTRGYGFEIPVTYNVDRFKVPSLYSDGGLKVASLEFGINNYFKFIKQKHFIVFGPYMAIDLGSFEGDVHSLGLNIGYGYNFTKRLNLSLRYKYNARSLGVLKSDDLGSNTAVGFVEDYGIKYRYSQYSSLQLVLRFDLINTRRWKDPKTKNEPKQKPVVKNEPKAPIKKVIIDYSTYTDAALLDAKKDAKNLNDIIAIDKELEKRKSSVSEFDKYTDTELKELLNTTIAKEDYDKAEVIKNEIKKREVVEKSKPIDPNSLDSKTLEELTALLDAAVAKEDYDRAAEIKEAN